MMKPEFKRKLIGGLVIAFGTFWVWMCFHDPLLSFFSKGDFVENIFFLLTIVPLMALPGGLAIYWGIRLFKKYENSTVKWLAGTFTAYCVLFLSGALEEVLPDVLPERLVGNLTLFGFTCLGIPFYCFLTRKIIKYASGETLPFSSLLSRGIILLFAWELWLVLSMAFDEYAPHKEGNTHITAEPWGFVSILLPILVAYLLYRILLSKLMKAQQQPSSESPSSIQTG